MNLLKMNKIICLLVLFISSSLTVSAQICLGCSSFDLYEKIKEEDLFFNVYFEEDIHGDKYWISNHTRPVGRTWRMKNDTFDLYKIILSYDSESTLEYSVEIINKNYCQVSEFCWIKEDIGTQIELFCVEGIYQFHYTKLNENYRVLLKNL